jgi:CRP-like cAMP-binding protein
MDERHHILSGLSGLEGTPSEVIAELARNFDLRQYANIELCREGDEADRLWVLGSGSVMAMRMLSTRRPCEVARLSPTILMGFSGLAGMPKRSATLKADGQVEVLEISTEAAMNLLHESASPAAAAFRRVLIAAVGRQVATTNTNIAKLAVDLGLAQTDVTEEALLASITLH